MSKRVIPPPSSRPDFAMFSHAANQAVADLLNATSYYHLQSPSRSALLLWWRARLALLAAEYPEVHDTAVREEIWRHLSKMKLPEGFIREALTYMTAGQVLAQLLRLPPPFPTAIEAAYAPKKAAEPPRAPKEAEEPSLLSTAFE